MPVPSRQSIALSGAALLAAACLGTAVPALLPGGPETAHAAGPNRPNIILIRTDDQTRKQLRAYTMPRTTRLLAEQGTAFTDSVVTTPLCCPSRAAVLTGQYGHNNGVLSNNPGYQALREKGNTLPVWLQRAGYRTAHVGKYLNHHSDSVQSHCRTMDGRSLLGLLSGNTTRWPDDRGLLLELDQQAGGNAGVCTYQGARVGDRIYTEYSVVTDQATGACEPTSERELYKLGSDPHELDNLADTAAHSVEQLHLSNRLDRLRNCAGIAGRDQQVNGRPFCE